jgi:sRNA-binding regulator protein Hfq
LLSGESFSGVVKSFGLYNLLLTVADGCEVLLLKSAIAWARKATTTTTAATGTTGGRP